jgi:hypothetical protein
MGRRWRESQANRMTTKKPNAFLILLLFDPSPLHGGRFQAKSVVCYLEFVDFFEDFLEPLESVFCFRHEVRIAGWPMGLVCPKLEEERSLQNECISVLGLADTAENPFQREFNWEKIESLLFGSRSVQEALLHRCFGVVGDRSVQARDSIFGR